ncbi:MAG: DegT/DnrJ/EryC1/StrS aminotransferase family protein [Nitrospina sp.]|jgi:dTDP-4-amino-4,6-dideoxygalactose transaminase|nr:DegT/DnrJ/EryC1/StrS aminotransferase family protein [Nitrospina sp.]
MIKVSQGCLGEEEVKEVLSAFEYGYFGLAAKVDEFEQDLGSYLGATFAVATNSGTNAMHLALDSLGIGKGDEVIVPSLTFVASFQAISATGARPVACDVLPDTLLIDVEDARKRISKNTKAIMPVHYVGSPCDMEALLELKELHGIRIVEDAAHAFGSTFKGKKIGSFGDITCFSFDSLKNITCGEGGLIICNEKELYELCRKKRNLGLDRKNQTTTSWKERSWSYDVVTQGFRYHMSNINAAIGLAQLRKADEFIFRRREICKKYDDAFQVEPGIKLLRVDYATVAPHIYVIRVRNNLRDPLKQYLQEQNIETGISYIPNHLHTFYRENGLSLPETEKAYKEILTLPLHCKLSDSNVDRVIACVHEFFNQKKRSF